ncbi:hypothetical protein [Xanthomonas fragariae]|uniref:hypothetical protein n=1 Tax=Xanthomonas fragariae TaxID=48664 RepID=UPI0022AB07AE|nr:hypothetical protein [Xanthomonas fragariae]WAT16443.1 hypothetical protein OZ429_09465 [Xanthomonas fragariae]
MKFFLILSGFIISCIAPEGYALPIIDASRKVEQLAGVVQKLPPSIQHQMLVESYRELYPEKADVHDLQKTRERFDAAVTSAFYSKDQAISLEVASLYDLLDDRHVATERDLHDVIGVLVKSRQLKIANDFSKSHGLQATIPPSLDRRGPVTDAPATIRHVGHSLMIESVDQGLLDSGVVVIASPLCHFTRAAGDAIIHDSNLSGDLKGSLWIVPPETSLHLEEIDEWNSTHAEQQMAMAYNWLAWRQITDWSTPGFYFFRDKKLVAEVHGWPINGSKKKELIDAVKKWKSAGGKWRNQGV